MKILKFTINHKYKIKLSFEYSSVPSDVLTYYYLPLLGSNAFSLYFFFLIESKNFYTNEIFIGQERIIAMLNLPVVELEKTIRKLEILGLLEIFINPADNQKLTYVLNEPLFHSSFTKNQKLMTLLKSKIGEDNYYQNAKFFKNSLFNKNDELISITSEIDLSPLALKHQEHDLKLDYDFKLLFDILDSKNIQYESYWAKELEEEIKNVIALYQLSTLEIAKFIEILVQKNNLSRKSFIEHVDKVVNIDPGDLDELLNTQANFLIAKKTMLDESKPLSFFKVIFLRTPTKKEKIFLKELVSQYGFSYPMINRLIDYSNLINNGIMNSNFLGKIADTCLAKGINDVEKLEIHLKAANLFSDRFKNKKTTPQIEDDLVINPISIDEIEKVFKEIK